MEEPKHLRGHLEVEVQEAFDLPNLDKNQGRPGNLSDPYVVVRVLGPKRTEKKLGRTHTIDDCLNPKWWYTLNAEIDSEVLEIRFDVKDEDTFRADKIGSCTVPVIAFINTGEYRGCLVLRNKKGESAGRLKICVRFCGNLNRQVVAASRPTCKIRGCVQRRRTCSIEDKNIIFHGKMIINIESAEDLPNLDSTFLNKENKTDPFVSAFLVDGDERWRKQGIFRDAALDCRDIDANFYYEGDDYWNAQIFRSICEDSLTFRTADPENIITKQGRKIDNSLHRAYIHQIQASEKFVYLENQYFIGSSHMWKDCRDTPVRNLVPLEIAKKIVDKIRKGEEFVAYIVFPMFPEGNPVDVVTQEILHWQYHTMEMMYGMIGNTIQEMGHDTTPQDYLLFFCLGLRVGPASVPQNLTPPTDEAAALSFKNRRSMIYVHSKLAIFDDNYIIVGSANINDRSLAGARDTEIAMGAYQPKVGPRVNNDIATFRKCLWSEHLGSLAPLELDPGSILCARKVRRIAEDSLMRYIDVQKPLPLAHLLSYPLSIDRRGVVTSRPDCEFFPDTKAMVLGTRSKVLPSFLTT
ncbi:hypothetical protein HAZT_HAZT005882 [Hyalella azteca]|uniref:phospholipase D n=1 Tax=Hyalella azteca TaxID=294128 RepID=A0A6A0HET1_HYAAZ|nr:hypothetical protein HAZT_HAZT005882 [Hyalella azteca]